MGVNKAGQGATEYLVLLAVVLIIALVSIALLGFFPGLATDARITQSASYWKGEARPFAILEHSVSSSGTAQMVLQNVDASGLITLESISVGADTYSPGVSFGPGETKVLDVPTVAAGTAGSVYEFPINLTYTTSSGLSQTQFGSKPIVGKYN